jgi:hypothetical protein
MIVEVMIRYSLLGATTIIRMRKSISGPSSRASAVIQFLNNSVIVVDRGKLRFKCLHIDPNITRTGSIIH